MTRLVKRNSYANSKWRNNNSCNGNNKKPNCDSSKKLFANNSNDRKPLRSKRRCNSKRFCDSNKRNRKLSSANKLLSNKHCNNKLNLRTRSLSCRANPARDLREAALLAWTC